MCLLNAGDDDPIICHCLDKPSCQDVSHCTEYALVTPSDLAAVEEQDAQIADFQASHLRVLGRNGLIGART